MGMFLLAPIVLLLAGYIFGVASLGRFCFSLALMMLGLLIIFDAKEFTQAEDVLYLILVVPFMGIAVCVSALIALTAKGPDVAPIEVMAKDAKQAYENLTPEKQEAVKAQAKIWFKKLLARLKKEKTAQPRTDHQRD